jgi:outer membrane cobalamin receptor
MLNIGAAYSLSQSGILQELTLSTDAYCGRVSDKIVAVPGIFIWKMSNVDEVLLSGIDANVSTKIKLGHSSHLEFSGAYSYMHAVDNTEGSAVKGEQIIYTPRHSGSASTALRTLLLVAGYSLVWSCERYRLAQNIPSSRVDGYCDHSIWLSRDWTIGKLVLSTRIEAMNLLDKNYEIIRYYPMPGRSVRLSATINL